MDRVVCSLKRVLELNLEVDLMLGLEVGLEVDLVSADHLLWKPLFLYKRLPFSSQVDRLIGCVMTNSRSFFLCVGVLCDSVLASTLNGRFENM